MRFTHVRLGNWRNFRSVEVDLQERVFLVGPNASGKSNFLDALRFLRDIASVGGGFQGAAQSRGGVSRIRCLAARSNPDVSIEATIGTSEIPELWTYQLTFAQDKKRRTVVRRERVLREGSQLFSRPDDADRSDPDRLTQTWLEQVTANREFRELADFMESINYLHIVPQLVREPDRSVGRINDPFGGDFLEQIARTNKKTRASRLRKIREALKVAVPQLSELSLDPDQRGTWHLQGKYQHWRPQGAWQNEADFSDGTLRLIGLLWALLNSGGPLLLEEPELSLHPEVVRYIPQIFARVQRSTNRQIFVSTHSSELLRDGGIGLNEVLLLIPGPEGTQVSPASRFQDIQRLLSGGVPLADAVLPTTMPANAQQLALFTASK